MIYLDIIKELKINYLIVVFFNKFTSKKGYSQYGKKIIF